MDDLTHADWQMIDETLGGRYDSLLEILPEASKNMRPADLKSLKDDIEAIRPTVERIRQRTRCQHVNDGICDGCLEGLS